MRKHTMQVQYNLSSATAAFETISSSVSITVSDNTRWDVVSAVINKLANELSIVLPTDMMSWVLNFTPEFVYYSGEVVTCVFKLPLDKIRPLKSTDMQICLGKYALTAEGTYL